MKNHEHKWQLCSHTGHPDGPYPFTILFRCYSLSCDERRERLGTREEFEKLEVKWVEEPNVHTVWHEFVKKFKQKDSEQYKYTGYDLMCRVEKWAAKHPDYVIMLSCDDTWFSSSNIVLIEHRTDESFMGVTLVCIPQNNAGNGTCLPTEMFLYQHHFQDLISAFSKKIVKRYKEIRKIEVVKEEERRKMLDSIKFEQALQDA